MPIIPRPYEDGDLPRLQAAVAGWTRDAGPVGSCHPGDLAHRISENHPAGERVQVWEDGPLVVGVAIELRFGTTFDAFVAPSHRGTDDERAILRAAQGRSTETDVIEGDDERIRLLAELGFARYRVWTHLCERDLAGPIGGPAPAAGATIRVATDTDHDQLAQVRNLVFGSDWTAARYLDAMGQRGQDGAVELVATAADGAIAAFAVVWFDEVNRIGLLEPVGTHPDHRRRGLARALLGQALRLMQERAMATAAVAHDADNQAAAALYRGLGFQPCGRTLGFRRS